MDSDVFWKKRLQLKSKWFYAFWSVSLVVFVLLMLVAPKIGITGDEFLDSLNGKYALAYYADGDETFTDFSQVEELKTFQHIIYYGTGFEILPWVFVRYFHMPESQIYLCRHFLGAFFGFLLILFVGLIARKISDWKAGTFALLLMVLSPTIFGLSFIASKDVPFAAGFAIAIYAFVSIFQTFPKFKVGHVLLAIYGIALAISVRIGGLMLPAYLVVMFTLVLICNKEKRKLLFAKPMTLLWKSLGIGTLIVVVGSFLGLSFYPNFFYAGPVEHIRNAFTLVSKFPQRIPMLFEGKMIDSIDLPEYYLLKSFLYTIPLFVFGAAFLTIANLRRIVKKYDVASLLFILFTVIFPLVLISIKDSNLYNGWRHLTFTYAGFIVLCAIGLVETTQWFSEKRFGKYWSVVCPCLIFLSFIPTLVWMIQNYKYTASYYNYIVGDPYMKYDIDPYATSQTICFDWLLANEIDNTTDTIKVGCNNYNVVDYCNKLRPDKKLSTKHLERLIVEEASVRGFSESDADYTIISVQFLPSKVIKRFFPPEGTIHVETYDGHPIAAVVKRNKLDSRAVQLMRNEKIEEGMVVLDSAYNYDPNNFGLWFWLGYGYYYSGQYEKSIEFLDKFFNFWPNQEMASVALMYEGASQYELHRYDDAINTLLDAESWSTYDGNLPFIYAYLGLAYYDTQKYRDAIPYLEAGMGTFPFLQEKLNYCKSR